MAKNDFTRLTGIALFAALIAFGSYLTLPLFSIPFTAQSLFVLLAGLILGHNIAPLAVILWLLLGMFGLPVFAGGSGGLAIVLGPRGGYLFGYILMAYLAGVVSQLPSVHSKTEKKMTALVHRSAWRTIQLLPALFSIYLIALPWLRWRTGMQPIDANDAALGSAFMSWNRTLAIGFWPFLITDLIKAFLAAFTYELLFIRKKSK